METSRVGKPSNITAPRENGASTRASLIKTLPGLTHRPWCRGCWVLLKPLMVMSKRELEYELAEILSSLFFDNAEELAETLVAQLAERNGVQLSGKLLGKKEAAQEIGVSEEELEALADDGEIRRQPVRFSKKAVDDFVMRRYYGDAPRYHYHRGMPR